MKFMVKSLLNVARVELSWLAMSIYQNVMFPHFLEWNRADISRDIRCVHVDLACQNIRSMDGSGCMDNQGYYRIEYPSLRNVALPADRCVKSINRSLQSFFSNAVSFIPSADHKSVVLAIGFGATPQDIRRLETWSRYQNELDFDFMLMKLRR